MENEQLSTITGTVEDVIFGNAQNGYMVFTMDVGGVLISAVGTIGEISEGERLTLHGGYISSPKYGRQFKAQTCERALPETTEEIKKYLGSGVIRGLGPALARRIVAAFGTDTLDVIENNPHMLSQIKGITADRANYISVEYKRICGVRNVIEFLGKYRFGPVSAIAVWHRYDSESIDTIKDNPYVLCENGIDLDFIPVDEMAQQLGFERTSLSRIEAGISFVLRENSFAGHTCLPIEKLRERVCRALETGDGFDEALRCGIERRSFTSVEIRDRTFVYLTEYYDAEHYVADKLSQMLKLNIGAQHDYSDEIAGVEWSEGITYEILQKAAINGSLSNSLFILTGGPGTGKTTTLNAVIRLFKEKGKRLALAAPTGRAAKRMSDLTGENAKTIHRLLEVDFSREDKLAFKHNELNPLKADVVIIDEMSMVDIMLFEALLRAIKLDTKLIMVGDSNQLPSVGAGNVLRDLVTGGLIPCVELKEIFRQAAQSLIITNAHRIVKGEMPELNDRQNDFFFMSCENEQDIPRLVIELTKKRLPATYGYSPIDDVQILAQTKLGCVGTRELNKGLQLALNPPSRDKAEVKFFDVVFRTGDKVMQIKNDYDIVWKKGGEEGTGVFNGDIGIVREVDRYSGNMTIDFDGRMAIYTADMLQKLEHAYAVTIHKSQGSEYNAVIIPLTGFTKQLLYRNLLYTGVTRAKKILILIGRKALVEAMVANDRKTLRYSLLKPMLSDDMKRMGEL